jgi:hypothetical protein
VTAAFSAMLLSANLATPLYAVWVRLFEFSTAVLALIFAFYALVLVPLVAVATTAPRRSRPSGRPGCRTGSGPDLASGTELTVTCHSPPGRPGP